MAEKIDFSNVEDNDFSPLPAGEYEVNLFDFEKKESSTGKPMFKLTMKVAEGEHEGRQIFTNLVITPKALWKVKEALEAFGKEVPKAAIEVDFEELLGRRAVAVVGHREYNGNIYDDVKKLKKSEAAMAAEVPF